MSALVLDAGAFLAVERHDRSMIARLRVTHERGLDLRTHAMVVARVWRDPSGRQVELARLLKAVQVEILDEQIGRAAGLLLGATNMSDPIDAAVVLIAQSGDRIVTSDPDDIRRLAAAAPRAVAVVAC